MPGMRLHDIIDVNHYTIVMTDAGADQVAPIIHRALDVGDQHEEVEGR